MPSLLQASAQRVRLTRFKTDPKDHTISISILIVVGFNADFDGDALNVSIGTDNLMADRWLPLAPEYNIFALDVPGKISRNITIPKPIIATISEYLEG
jgi:hypothetical protein